MINIINIIYQQTGKIFMNPINRYMAKFEYPKSKLNYLQQNGVSEEQIEKVKQSENLIQEIIKKASESELFCIAAKSLYYKKIGFSKSPYLSEFACRVQYVPGLKGAEFDPIKRIISLGTLDIDKGAKILSNAVIKLYTPDKASYTKYVVPYTQYSDLELGLFESTDLDKNAVKDMMQKLIEDAAKEKHFCIASESLFNESGQPFKVRYAHGWGKKSAYNPETRIITLGVNAGADDLSKLVIKMFMDSRDDHKKNKF